jgi:phage tail-like protein
MRSDDDLVSSYLQYLPATFQSQKISTSGSSPDPALAVDPLLGRFLLAFERILTGLSPEDRPAGIEQLLSSIPSYFDPQRVPAEFLSWLAGWIGVTLRGDWSEAQQRDFLQQIPALYPMRGTLACMSAMLTIFLGKSFTISEFPTPSYPHYFQVSFPVPDSSSDTILLYSRAVRAIIDQEKPAYTFYGLDTIITTPMTLPCIVGVTTTLGTPSSSSSSSSSAAARR